jgi:hypothetical protein
MLQRSSCIQDIVRHHEPAFIAVNHDRTHEANGRFFGLEGSINPIFG